MSGAADRSILARNTVWSVVGYGFQFLVPIFLVPYIVAHVGKETYGGLWVTLFTLASWVGFYDLGLWGSIPKDVAGCRAQNDGEGLCRLWATWLWYDLVLGALSVGAVALFAPWIVHRFSTVSDPSASTLFIGLAVQAATGPLLRHLNATLNGLQRLDLANLMAILVTPLWAGGQIGFLAAGWGLRGLMINGLIFSALQVVWLVILIAREKYPITFSPAQFSRSELRRLLSFGWKMQAQLGINQAFRNDRVVMGNQQAAGATIAAYQFGSNIVDRLSGAIVVLSSGVLSAASDLAARGDLDRVRILFLRGTKYHALAAFGLLGFAALFGRELMMFWMGEPLPESVAVLRIMAAGGGWRRRSVPAGSRWRWPWGGPDGRP